VKKLATKIYFVETTTSDRRITLCHWVDTFYEKGRMVQVVTDSTSAAQHLDQLLWTFAQGSFIPHRIYVTDQAEQTDGSPNPCAAETEIVEPVILTIGSKVAPGYEVIVADSPVDLDLLLHYKIAVHFVLLDSTEQRQESRLLWQRARDQGVEMEHITHRSPKR
jgi:DNA polymerase III subunit chi